MTLGPLGAFCNSVTKSRIKIPAQTSVLEWQAVQLVLLSHHTTVKYFNSFVVEFLCVPKA